MLNFLQSSAWAVPTYLDLTAVLHLASECMYWEHQPWRLDERENGVSERESKRDNPTTFSTVPMPNPLECPQMIFVWELINLWWMHGWSPVGPYIFSVLSFESKIEELWPRVDAADLLQIVCSERKRAGREYYFFKVMGSVHVEKSVTLWPCTTWADILQVTWSWGLDRKCH